MNNLKKLDQSVFNGLPPEYRFADVDANGRVFVYDCRPCVKCFDGKLRLIPEEFDATDWQNSLIERKEEEAEANTKRTILCVNACEGFSNEDLEGANLFNDSIESQGEIINLINQRDELSARAEQLECQLAGCGVAALQNTRDSAAQRGAPGDYGYSGSYEEVCRAVDREMAMREQRDELLNILQRLKAVDFGEHWNSDAEQAAISARELITKFEVESDK